MDDFLGPVKTKSDKLFLKLVKKVSKPDYTMHFMEDRHGRKAMFYNYKGVEIRKDDCVLLKATIAEHRTDRYDGGTPLTYLNRVLVKRNMGSVQNPKIVMESSLKFGSQCIVVAIDAKRNPEGNSWQVYTHGGRKPIELDAVEWAKEVENRGAGEILLTSMDADGTKDGYDIELNAKVSESLNIPVIASGGAGKLEHMAEVLDQGKADAVLAASIFHFGEFTVGDVKNYLSSVGVPVRPLFIKN